MSNAGEPGVIFAAASRPRTLGISLHCRELVSVANRRGAATN
ncbi:MAG TPA: hypothetical protein VIX73_22315 [Kofleriaceae bacterium]